VRLPSESSLEIRRANQTPNSFFRTSTLHLHSVHLRSLDSHQRLRIPSPGCHPERSEAAFSSRPILARRVAQSKDPSQAHKKSSSRLSSTELGRIGYEDLNAYPIPYVLMILFRTA
jgi:hypothetical protein